jgi:hypothetical protein
MASKVVSFAAKRLMKDEFKKYSDKGVGGEYDPLFEMRPDKRGRMKKYKKQIPAYIPDHDAAILAKVRKRAYKLDMALFNFMGVRFGWSSVIGLIPELGDVIDMIMAMSLFRACCKVDGGLPNAIKTKMLFWIFVDFVIGLVPFLGDILDAAVKANSMNVRMLEQHLDKKYQPESVKKAEKERRTSDPNYRPAAPATVYEDSDDDRDLSPPPGYGSEMSQPESAPVRPQRAHTGRSGKNGRAPDEEMGYTREELRKARR